MEILIINRQKKLRLKPALIKKSTIKILRNEGIRKASLSLVFVSHQKIRALNKQFLNRNYATDVLAFDALDQTKALKRTKKKFTKLAGDIIISTDAVVKNSKTFHTQPTDELILYIIHGILHLCGHDDHGKKNIATMRKKEEELLKKVF